MKTTGYLIFSAMVDLIVWIVLVRIGIHAVQQERWVLLAIMAVLTGIYGAISDAIDEAGR